MCHLSAVRVPKEQAGTTRSRVSSPSDDFLNRIACRSSKIVMHCFSRIPFDLEPKFARYWCFKPLRLSMARL